jgi:nucleoside-diphosphate-sugar epimerase
MQSPQNLWTNKICLVTGAFGFVGTHLCRDLISRGAIVVALDLLPNTKGTYFGLAGIEGDTTVLQADIRNTEELLKLREFNFDVVFHLAAQPISPLSNIQPDETMATNVNGTANLGEVLSLQPHPPLFIFASSACWYGATIKSPLKEEDSYVEGEFKYSESKVLAEREVLKIERLYGIPGIRCRFVNLYGPGDRHFSRIIPKTIRHLIKGEQPSLVRNNGTTVLDFMRVEEAVSALIIAAEHGRAIRGEVFNFGVAGNNPRSALEVVKLVSVLFDGVERSPLLLNALVPKTKNKFLDNSKAASQLGWKPSKSLEEGLSTTINWYAENIEKIEALEF